MTHAEIERLKVLLQSQLETIRREVARLGHDDGPAVASDINDQATLESERSFELRLRDRAHKLGAKVEEALRQMDEGTYGICESCEEEIGFPRLAARPVTTLCIHCKAEREAEERREKRAATAATAAA